MRDYLEITADVEGTEVLFVIEGNPLMENHIA